MRKNITIGFSPPEYLRLQGAAAVSNMPIATYVKWLLQGRPTAGASNQMTAVLERLDQIGVAVARLSPVSHSSASHQPQDVSGRPARTLIETKLRERGVPTSTIRQVTAVLEELSFIR